MLSLTGGIDQYSYHYLTLRSFSADGSLEGEEDVRAVEVMCDNGSRSHVSVHHVQQKVTISQPFLLFDSLYRPRPLGQLQYCWWESEPVFPCL
jgi:hypothetical protein